MEYAKLKAKAKALGLKYTAVSVADLEKSIAEKEKELDDAEARGAAPDAEAGPATNAEPTEKDKAPKDTNVAIILDGSKEIRRFSLELHGENFVELANGFAENRGYQVKFENVKEGIKCPACGHKFNLE